MLCLAIESSCDETSLALLKGEIDSGQDFFTQINSFRVLGSIVSSQIEVHKFYGGVVPEIGARQHAEAIHWMFEDLLRQINIQNDVSNNISASELQLETNRTLSQITQIFVTSEPGLISALRVGMEFGKTIKFFLEKKFNSIVELEHVNHLQGHVISCFYQQNFSRTEQGIISTNSNSTSNLQNEKDRDSNIFPHLHLLVSGGNTQIILLRSPTDWQIIGKTLDDAAGECFDKVGRMLGLPYPGGVHLARIAGLEESNYFDFPVSMSASRTFDFSYSGLKTAVRYFLEARQVQSYHFEERLAEEELNMVNNLTMDHLPSDKLKLIKRTAISAQTVVISQLINQFIKAMSSANPQSIGMSGGVSANLLLRHKFSRLACPRVLIAPKELTGDNAVMIGLVGITKKLLAKK